MLISDVDTIATEGVNAHDHAYIDRIVHILDTNFHRLINSYMLVHLRLYENNLSHFKLHFL